MFTITKELHKFLKDVFINKKSVQIYDETVFRWKDIDINDWLINQNLRESITLRVKPELYKHGDRFKRIDGSSYILHNTNQEIEYCDDDRANVYNTFCLYSFKDGLYYGNPFTVRNKEGLTVDELLQITDNKQLFKSD